jgi:hypothetical protein
VIRLSAENLECPIGLLECDDACKLMGQRELSKAPPEVAAFEHGMLEAE